MKAFKSMAISFALVVAGAILVPSVQAQSTFHRITHVTLSGPVQIPGKVLPAGEYVFQLDVLPSNETSIVEIRDKTGERVISTLLTIPDYRLTPTGKTVILFRERAAGSPAALRAWFYPGENYGHEFAYPMREAKQIANANHENVPAVADNTSDSDLKGAQVTEAKPEGNAEASNQTTTNNEASATSTDSAPNDSANNSAPAPAQPQYQNPPASKTQSNNLFSSNQPLPKTASPIFLIASMGGIFVSMGLLLGFFLAGRQEGERSL
jgi:hypothetical protein